MSQHDTQAAEPTSNADSVIDAKSIVALVAIIVVTACFWLLGQ